MSQVKRAGKWVDEGPSSAAATDAMSRLNRLAIPGLGNAPTGGAGPIERRLADEAQRAQWREEAAEAAEARRNGAPPGTFAVPADRMKQAQRNGQETRRQQREAARSTPLITLAPDPVTEEPAMPEPSSTPEPEPEPRNTTVVDLAGDDLEASLPVVADALVEAMEALGARRAAEERWQQARQALEASWAATGLTGQPPLIGVHDETDQEELDDGLLARTRAFQDARMARIEAGDPEPVVKTDADHASTIPVAAPSPAARMAAIAERAASAAAGEPEEADEPEEAEEPPRARPAHDPAGLTIGQRRVLDALVKHGGDRAIAANVLGQKAQSVATAASVITRIGGAKLTDVERKALGVTPQRAKPA